MIVRMTSTFDYTENDFWKKIIEPKSLQYVASPILSFHPIAGEDLGAEWVTDKMYKLKLRLVGILPLGRHQIKVIKIDLNSTSHLKINEVK